MSMDAKMDRARWAYGAICIVVFVMTATWAAKARADQGPPPPPVWIFYDLTHDGAVNDADLAVFAQYWIDYHLNGTYNAAADFNGDDKINYFDAMQIIQAYLLAQAASSQSAKGQAQSQAVPKRADRKAAGRAKAMQVMVEQILKGQDAAPAGRAQRR